MEASINTINSQLASHKLNSNAVPQLKEKLATQTSDIRELNSTVELEKQLSTSKFTKLYTELKKINTEKENYLMDPTKEEINIIKASQASLVERMAKHKMVKTNNVQSPQLMQLQNRINLIESSNKTMAEQLNSTRGLVSSTTNTPTSTEDTHSNRIVDSQYSVNYGL